MFRLTCIGNVGKDPVKRVTQSGIEMVTFTLGVTIKKGVTKWIDVTCFNKTAELVEQYVRKGSKLLIEGQPDAQAYIDKTSNEIVKKLGMVANSIEFLGGKQSEQSDVHELPSNDLKSDDAPF
jgi:single-strand DNA-binding protein